jgi:hypothetical protein
MTTTTIASTISPPEKVIDEVCVPLSKTDLWQKMRSHYIALGAEAWNQIPFHATNNPIIASSCAHVVMNFIAEVVRKNEHDHKKPFYILELGAGLGKFGFYMLQQIKHMQQMPGLKDIHVVYVMSDIAEKNIDFWRNHPALKEFIAEGLLDFAQYQFNSDKPITLAARGEILHTGVNPLIVIANYFFDSLAQDLFMVKDGQLHEGALGPIFDTVQSAGSNTYLSFDQLKNKPTYNPITLPYYDDKVLNDVLRQMQDQETDRYYLFPKESLQGLNRITQCLASKVLLLVNDKGFGNHGDLYSQKELGPAFHGSVLSFPVDYRLISQFCNELKGSSINQSFEHDLSAAAFSIGLDLAEYPSTAQAFGDYFDAINPGDVCNLNYMLWQTKYSVTLDSILSTFKLNGWDPEIFSQYINEILQLIPNSPAAKSRDLIRCFPKFEQQFYRSPGSADLYLHFAAVYQATQHYESAIHCLHRSINEFGENDHKRHNMGLCYYHLKDYRRAEIMFKRTILLNKNDVAAKGWLSYAQEMLAQKRVSANDTLVPQSQLLV